MTILIALLAFGVMIGVHEAGHLLAAKLSGVLVHEFAIGMGPKLISWQGKETKYSLRLLPIGGYCNLEGENGGSDNTRAFCNAKRWQKLWILASGAIMNLVLGFILLICFYAGMETVPEPVVSNVIAGTPAQQMQLQKGDRIVKMNDSDIDIYPDLKFFLQKNGTNPFDLTIERDGKEIVIKDFKPYTEDANVLLGIQISTPKNSVSHTIKNAYHMEFFMGKIVLSGLWELATGDVSIKEASGPVGIVNEVGKAAESGWMDLFYIIALITINLGLFNLLPIPALDGGRILFVLISMIIRRDVPEKVETAFHTIGMLLLLALMLFITFNDVGRIF
ncbi:MAG: RIP metalloprotease RseP [Clostridia bacterium]|nr:RIP metalloprotease RseP [Clostridia bacterium]